MRSTPQVCFSSDCAMARYTVLWVDMIKETIPELQKLSTADKFALAVELWAQDGETASLEAKYSVSGPSVSVVNRLIDACLPGWQ
jgi:hypothetical protein